MMVFTFLPQSYADLREERMFVRNIKLSVKIECCPLDIAIKRLTKKKVHFSCFGNFITFKKKFSFVLFRPSANSQTHVNVTKVPNLEAPVQECMNVLLKLLKKKIITYKVDNIIATTDLKKKLNLVLISQKNIGNILYNSERFPGLFIKFGEGTSIVYHSGKVVIVGCKTVRRLKTIEEWLTANI